MFSITANAATDQPARDASEPLIQCYESFDGTTKEYLLGKCTEADIPVEYMAAIAYNESRFTADAINKANSNGTWDWGMMQINDSCFEFARKNCGINAMSDLLDPYENIDCAIQLFLYHRDFTHDNDMALLRYQVGEGTYAKLSKNGKTTKTYDTVITYVAIYRDYFSDNSFQSPATTCCCLHSLNKDTHNNLCAMLQKHKSAPMTAVGFAEETHEKGDKDFLGESPKVT